MASEESNRTSDRTGHVQTVMGLISPESLGQVLMHEHILVDYARNFGAPMKGTARSLIGGLTADQQKHVWEAPLTMENFGHVKHYFNQNKDNMVLDDVDLMADEVRTIKAYGGGTIVECTSEGIHRNPTGLREISRRTGVHVVAGTGHYLARVHPPDMDAMTVETLADKFVKEITVGIGETDVRAGMIGELGCSTELHPNEEKVLRAAAVAQKRTGIPIIIHPGYSVDSPITILNILESSGADLSRVIMGHVDRGILSVSDIVSLATRGCAILFDQFGWDLSFTHALSHGIDYPSDFERCRMIAELSKKGFLRQVVIGHDLAFKMRLMKYGGSGYVYIMKNIVPYMLKRGFTTDDIRSILVENPKRLLTINK